MTMAIAQAASQRLRKGTVGGDTNPNWGDIQINDRTAAKTDTITVNSNTTMNASFESR